MRKTAFLIMFITLLAKVFGFGREITLAYIYGASGISDAYLISTTIPNVIFGFIVAGIVAGYIPVYSKILKKEGETEADFFTNNLINTLIIISTILIIFVLIFATPIVKLFASGFQGEVLRLAVIFLRISIISIYFIGIISVYSGYLQIKNNFITPALIVVPLNIIIIISIIISNKFGTIALPIGFVLANLLQFVIIIPFFRKYHYKYSLVLNLKDTNIIHMLHIVTPVILGVSVNQVNVLVDRTLASRMSEGGISALNYADRLNGFAIGIFVLSIVSFLYPKISKLAAENDISKLKKSLISGINSINFFILPITVGTMIFSEQIVTILFGRGAFDSQAILLTSSILFFYSIGMIGVGLRELISRVFYSIQDTKTPMINAVIGVILNIILNIILSRYLGIKGLALATSISAILTAFLMIISLKKRIGTFGISKLYSTFIKILVSSLVMGLIAKLIFNYLNTITGEQLSFLISISVGAIFYFVISYFLRVNDTTLIFNAVKRSFIR